MFHHLERMEPSIAKIADQLLGGRIARDFHGDVDVAGEAWVGSNRYGEASHYGPGNPEVAEVSCDPFQRPGESIHEPGSLHGRGVPGASP